MGGVRAKIARSLELTCAVALFVAGGFWLVDTALLAFDGVVAVSNRAQLAIKLAAVLASAVGLLGLSPRLADSSPIVALAGGAFLAFSGVASIVLLVPTASAGAVASIAPPPAVAASVPFVALLLGTLLYGSASLFADRPSRSVGTLLLAHFGVLLAAIPATGSIEAGLVGAAAATLVTTASLLGIRTGRAGRTIRAIAPSSG